MRDKVARAAVPAIQSPDAIVLMAAAWLDLQRLSLFASAEFSRGHGGPRH